LTKLWKHTCESYSIIEAHTDSYKIYSSTHVSATALEKHTLVLTNLEKHTFECYKIIKAYTDSENLIEA